MGLINDVFLYDNQFTSEAESTADSSEAETLQHSVITLEGIISRLFGHRAKRHQELTGLPMQEGYCSIRSGQL